MTERLSRLIDGDLSPTEAESLRARLESDPVLRSEWEAMKRVRLTLQSLAAQDVPPAELDVLVDPLVLGRPDSRWSAPWVRWLATAAAVILGVTVVFEVTRRPPDMSVRNWQERATEEAGKSTERFTLAPLPSGSETSEDQPVGAADRLVAAPDPEVEPVLEPPPALEVLGPLEDGELGELQESKGRARKDEASGEPKQKEARSMETDTVFSTTRSAPGSRKQVSSAPADTRSVESAPPPTGNAAELSDLSSTNPANTGGQLFVFMSADTAWRSFKPDGRCEAGRYSVRIRVEGGVVREVWPVANPPAPTRQVRASQLVLGLEVKDVPDGEYAAEVVVEPSKPPGK